MGSFADETGGAKTLEVSYRDPDLSHPAGAEIFVCLVLVFPILTP